MKEQFVDLHVHTTASDSTLTPDEVIKAAAKEGFVSLAITDHDSVSALETISQLGKREGIEIVPGVELSSEKYGDEVHILGYFIRWREDWFRKKLAQLAQAREERAKEIIKKLNGIGIGLHFEEVLEISGEGAIGRMHIARALEKKGYVQDVASAFRLYIGDGKPAYVRKFPLTPLQAIEMIRLAGGISSLAHPGLLKNSKIISEVIKDNVDAIEVFYIEHTAGQTDTFLELAGQYRLLVTGGSDCHGLAKGQILLGRIKLPYRYLQAIKDRKGI